MAKLIRIAVIDDHPLMREGIVHVLGSLDSFEIVGEGETKDDAIEISGRQNPDLLLLDLSIPGGGLAAARHIKENFPNIKIAILTVSESEQNVAAAIEIGASGYLLKGIGGIELERALREIYKGKTYVSSDLALQLLSSNNAGTTSTLTDQELQIAVLVREGLSNREIGQRLSLTQNTVTSYLTIIFQKTGARNRAALAGIAQRLSPNKQVSGK